MAQNDDQTLTLTDRFRPAISRFYRRRLQLMRTEKAFRQQNGKMIFGSIPAFLFCVMWLFIVDAPRSAHRFDLGLNLLFGIGAVVFALAAIFGVRLWMDSRDSG